MNRHELRLKLIFTIYQHRLLHKDIKPLVIENFDISDFNELDSYIAAVIDLIDTNENRYIDTISNYLTNWHFDRLNYVDQAILLVSAGEIEAKVNDKAIIINEAINIAKKYCDEDSFKYINGVLDKI